MEYKAITIIKHYEGCRLTVYNDNPKQPDKGVLTVGYGHTGKDVNALGLNAIITQALADVWLKEDIQWAQNAIVKSAKKYSLDFLSHELSALTSFVFNLGSKWLGGRYELGRVLASKHFSKVPEKLLLYHHQDGRPSLGLYRRRFAEGLVFQGWPVKSAIAEADSIKEVGGKPQHRPFYTWETLGNLSWYVTSVLSDVGINIPPNGFTKAICEFQARYDLVPDGLIGPVTWDKLNEVFHTNLMKSYTERGLT